MNRIFHICLLIKVIFGSRFLEEKHHFDEDNVSFVGRFFSKNGLITVNLETDIEYSYNSPPRAISHLPITFIMIDYEYFQAIKSEQGIDKIDKCNRMFSNAIYIREIDILFTQLRRIILYNKEIHNDDKPTLWYFLLLDCNYNTHKLFPDFPFIITDLTVIDNLASQFSYEEKYIMEFLSILLIIYFVFFIFFSKKILRGLKEEPNNHLTFCWFSSLFKLLYMFFQSAHLLIYSINGEGLFSLDILSLLFWTISQYILASLILFTLAGWGFIYRSLVDYDYLYPIIIILFIIHSVLFVLFSYFENSIDKFHDFDGYSGYLIVISKSFFFLIIIFLLNEIITKINYAFLGNQKLKNFYFNIGIIGIVYTMSFPILFYLTTFIDYFYRHKAIVCGDLIIQVLSVFILFNMFNSKKNAFSDYFMYAAPIHKIYEMKYKS